jgi:hypothetical protein
MVDAAAVLERAIGCMRVTALPRQSVNAIICMSANVTYPAVVAEGSMACAIPNDSRRKKRVLRRKARLNPEERKVSRCYFVSLKSRFNRRD